MSEKAPPRSFPFARCRLSCRTCGATTFYVRYDGVPLCPKHMNRRKKLTQDSPDRKDRDGQTRGVPK